jgi:hypothetical protein
MAQDEIQVAEHPILGSLRQALLTRDIGHSEWRPICKTPVTISNVERNIAFNSTGLYGREFDYSSSDRVDAATTRLHPPSQSNIVAMTAVAHGRGIYKKWQVNDLLSLAYTAFTAVRLESAFMLL